MVAWVFLIGVFNIALGYLVAASLADPPFWAGWKRRWELLAARAAKAGAQSPVEEAPTEPPPPAEPETASDSEANTLDPEPEPEPVVPATIAELPSHWLQQLAESGIVPKSYVEASAHVIRLEVGRYREQLLTAENRARANLATSDAGALKLVADDLRFVNQDWLEKQTTAAGMLAQRSGRLGTHEQPAKAVEQSLLDQAAQIRLICTALEDLDFTEGAEASGRRLLGMIGSLISSAHLLRDRMLDLLADLLRTGEQLEGLSPSVQLDYLTGLPNRVGTELLFDAWWQENPERSRPLSVALIDVDRFGRVNHRMGTRGGDRAISALGRLLSELIRKDRGYDRAGRVGGEKFLLLLGDTGPHNALAAAERIRQTVEATTFDDQGAEFEMTVSCGVVEMGSAESLPDVLHRVEQAVTFAKRSGRNRCAIDEGAGATALPPPQLAVVGRVVHLSAE
ncbi:MAG TPA: GGDEF domain-containing protein [Pirellulaceae bacterium]|nr:GGDEF domain-containing protein [Pirellulaceae bacterium]